MLTRDYLLLPSRPTDDGSILVRSGDRLLLWSPCRGARWRFAQQAREAWIDRTGATLVYWLAEGEDHGLVAFDVRSGRSTDAAVSAPVLDRSGSGILFIEGPPADRRVYAVGNDGSRHLRITSEPGGIHSARMSGNGEICYAVTEDGRLLRIDIAT